jgi:polyhydroxyalkanoate synthesis regulator phasin
MFPDWLKQRAGGWLARVRGLAGLQQQCDNLQAGYFDVQGRLEKLEPLADTDGTASTGRLWRVMRTLESRVEAFEIDGARTDLRVEDFDSLVGRIEALEHLIKREHALEEDWCASSPQRIRRVIDHVDKQRRALNKMDARVDALEKEAARLRPGSDLIARADALEALVRKMRALSAQAVEMVERRVQRLETAQKIHLEQHANHARAVSCLLAEFRAASDRVKRLRAPAFGTERP